jgi:hypothetical protein
VTHHQHPEIETHTQHYETVFIVGVVRVIVSNGILVKEDCLRFLEGNTVFPFVLVILPLIPFETDLIHMYNVLIEYGVVKCFVA